MYTKEEIWSEFCQLCERYDATSRQDERPPIFTLDTSQPFSEEESAWFKCQKLPGRYAGRSLDCESHGRLSFLAEVTRLTDSCPTAKSDRWIPKPHTMPKYQLLFKGSASKNQWMPYFLAFGVPASAHKADANSIFGSLIDAIEAVKALNLSASERDKSWRIEKITSPA